MWWWGGLPWWFLPWFLLGVALLYAYLASQRAYGTAWASLIAVFLIFAFWAFAIFATYGPWLVRTFRRARRKFWFGLGLGVLLPVLLQVGPCVAFEKKEEVGEIFPASNMVGAAAGFLLAFFRFLGVAMYAEAEIKREKRKKETENDISSN